MLAVVLSNPQRPSAEGNRTRSIMLMSSMLLHFLPVYPRCRLIDHSYSRPITITDSAGRSK